MKHKRTCLWIILTLTLVISAGCETKAKSVQVPINLQSPIPPSPTSEPLLITDDNITIGANTNCPDRESFGRVRSNIPGSNVLVGQSILFRWTYYPPEGTVADWANICVPTMFTLYLASAPNYNTIDTFTATPAIVENKGAYLMFHFYLYNSLQPHTSYRWDVLGHSGGIDIGRDPQPFTLFQDESAWMQIYPGFAPIDPYAPQLFNAEFQTGPQCDSQTISPPILLNPPDQSVLNNDTPHFQWDMPNCSSKAYRLAVFTDPNLLNVEYEVVLHREAHMIDPGILQPCTLYYWQVESGLYSPAYHLQSGDWATSSGIQTFIIRSAACPNAQAVPTPTATPLPTYRYNPTETPLPGRYSTPTPVKCSSLPNQDSCEAYGDTCTWVATGRGSEGYCKDN